MIRNNYFFFSLWWCSIFFSQCIIWHIKYINYFLFVDLWRLINYGSTFLLLLILSVNIIRYKTLFTVELGDFFYNFISNYDLDFSILHQYLLFSVSFFYLFDYLFRTFISLLFDDYVVIIASDNCIHSVNGLSCPFLFFFFFCCLRFILTALYWNITQSILSIMGCDTISGVKLQSSIINIIFSSIIAIFFRSFTFCKIIFRWVINCM